METTTQTETTWVASGAGTYGLRDLLKESGARWNGTTWHMTQAQYDRLCVLVGRVASPTGNAKARAYEAAWDETEITEGK